MCTWEAGQLPRCQTCDTAEYMFTTGIRRGSHLRERVWGRVNAKRFAARFPRSRRATARRASPAGFLATRAMTSLTTDVFRAATHLSVDVAMMFAMLEYLHVDCRLRHARQWGLVRSHCARSAAITTSRSVASCLTLRSPWSCARRTLRSSTWACCASASSLVARLASRCLMRPGCQTWRVSHRPPWRACTRKTLCQRGVAPNAGRSQAT
jgi:hypothetical protein